METGPAACVLLYDIDGNVVVMAQARVETGNKVFYKTVGGYLADGETHEQCLTRNLLNKLGVEATQFTESSRTFGYGDVIKVPIKLYSCGPGNWKVVKDGTCRCVSLSPMEVRSLINDDIIYDDATRLQLLLSLAGF